VVSSVVHGGYAASDNMSRRCAVSISPFATQCS
jgi:hypothetical protein